MDDFGSSGGGFSSSDAAGFSTDAGECNAFSSSDTGGISSSCGGVLDSGPFSVDTFSNIGMTSNCESGLGVSDYVDFDVTGNNAYYDASFQNSMESENVSAYPNHIQVDSSRSTYPIPVMPSAPYLTTTTYSIPVMPSAPYLNTTTYPIPVMTSAPYLTKTKYGVVDGYLNKRGNMKLWEKNIPCSKREDKELMLLRSKIAQLQIILASCKADEHKKAAVCAQIEDLTVRMERQGNGRRQDIFKTTNCQNHANTPTRVYRPTVLCLTPTHAGADIQKIKRMHRRCLIVFCTLVIVMMTAFALGMGLGFTQN